MESEVFSLEDDDYGDMFITQSGGQSDNLCNEVEKSNKESGLFLGLEETNFSTPCVSQFKSVHNPVYSDISDDKVFEDIQIPSSQKR